MAGTGCASDGIKRYLSAQLQISARSSRVEGMQFTQLRKGEKWITRYPRQPAPIPRLKWQQRPHREAHFFCGHPLPVFKMQAGQNVRKATPYGPPVAEDAGS